MAVSYTVVNASCVISVLSLPGEKYEQAIECAKTFLLFHPEDAVMAQNMAYYSAVLGDEKAGNITAREVPSALSSDAQACF